MIQRGSGEDASAIKREMQEVMTAEGRHLPHRPDLDEAVDTLQEAPRREPRHRA
jgi:succinate dehydrogenase/fumarate reductase flavoprotein subunit